MVKKNRRPRTSVNKSRRAEEILLCGTDPLYFIKNYVKIPHPTRGLIKFHLYPFQEDCLQAFQEHRRIIVNKSRQLGLSTSAAAYALWLAIFHREQNILVIATRLDTAKNFLKKVHTMLEGLPDWLVLPKLTGESVKYVQFSNGSQIKAVPSGKDAGRSEALSLLIVDEAAHVENIRPLWLGLQPTLSTGGNAILISSPSGVGTLFHEIWVGAHQDQNSKGVGKNKFFPIELPWTVHPEHDQEWFEEQKASIIQAMGERGLAQELLCSFMSSGDTFIKGEAMDRIHETIMKPEFVKSHGRDEAWLWKAPETGHQYVIGADVARGDGEDYSAFVVIDTNTDEVVADFKGKPPPDRFAELLIEYANVYNMALICQELNSVGLACAIKLKDSGYQNLFYEKHMKNMYMSYMSDDVSEDYPGFTTNTKTREEILAKLENNIRNGITKTYSKRLFEELQTFVYKNNKPQAQKGSHDDLIMALAIATNLYESSGNGSTHTSAEIAMALLNGMSRESKTLDPFTGQQSTHTTQQNVTADGMWSRPPGAESDGYNSLKSQLERQRALSLQKGGTHNYNDSQWAHLRWMFKD